MNRSGGGGIGGTLPRGTVIAPVVAPRMFVVAVTDARTGWAHLVTEESFTAGCRAGRYDAVCGRDVLAASLITPELGVCRPRREWRADR